jgi:glyoxylase-like metal-dependent hydrolase (beta-lactamase superfamily II)
MRKHAGKRILAAFVPLSLAIVFALTSCAKTQSTDIPGFKMGVLQIKALADMHHERDASILISPENPELLKHIPDDFIMQNIVAVILAQYKNEAILFDTGFGSANGGNLLNVLEKAKLTPDAITGIFITHMHPDHIGGLVHEGKPSFPKAAVYIASEEARYFLRDDLSDIPESQQARFANIAAIFEILRAAEIPIVTFPSGSNLEEYFGNGAFSFTSGSTFGHTPGHTVYKLASKGRELLIWGDILHVMDIQLAYPEICAVFDMDTVLAAKERRRILEYAAENKTIITGAHVAPEAFFTISKYEERFIRRRL